MNLHVSSTLDHFIEDNYSDGELTDKTLSDLRSTFSQYGHTPSEAMWVGLRALVDALVGMANGTLQHLPYLSPLDPGVGKTEAIVHFIRNLVASPSRGDIGVLICVSHLREIGTLIHKMGLAREDVAVFTRDDETNARGPMISTRRGFSS